jgi:hypothetical protein
MNRRKFLLPLILLSLALASWPLIANTIVEDLDISGFRPSPRYPGLVLAHPTPQSWQRCPLVHFRVNDNLDPIPNPLGPAFLRVEDTLPVFRQAAKLWNDIPTSFMEIQVDGTVDNPGRTRFDFVNEISFRTGPLGTLGFPNVAFRGVFERDLGIIAAVRRTTLLTDFEFVDGLDADGDGDVDFTASISQCGDQDSDGDIEMAAGAYKAGAIIDSDIMFATGTNVGGVTDPGFRYTIDPADIDANPRSVDLFAVAVQAFGLATGVGHSMTNQPADDDGTDSVLYPYIDASDPQSELDKRALDLDSILTASRRYPEGSAATGAAALQPGDVAFAPTVGYITGNVTLGATNQPLAGANVFAIDHTTGRVVSSTISGHTLWDTQRNGFNSVFTSVDVNVESGRYSLVVPPGVYDIGVEAVDDAPAGHQHINLETLAAFLLGQEVGFRSYDEEFYNGASEGALERDPGQRTPVAVRAGQTVGGIDMVINKTIDLANYGSLDSLGSKTAQPGTYYAVRIPTSQVLQAYASVHEKAIIQGGAFMTGAADSSTVPVFGEALFTTGRVNPDGSATLDLQSPLASTKKLVAQEFDFTPFWFPNAPAVSQKVRKGIGNGGIQDLFLVLRVPEDGNFPGFSHTPPLIGRDGGVATNDSPIYGYSYTSTDGRTFTRSTDFNFMFKLILSEDPL